MTTIKVIHSEETIEAQKTMDDWWERKQSSEPTIEIVPQQNVIRRRGNKNDEEIIPAFVKISTGFKAEMAGIDEISLKVWLFIALSVNRTTGKAFPGLRTIATGTGFAVNTVRAAIDRLENKYNLLTVYRDTARYNIYEPQAFVSANHTPISGVSSDDTPTDTVSDKPKTVSPKEQTVSARVILNQINQNKPDFSTTTAISKEIFKTYENEIGLLTPMIRDKICSWMDEPDFPQEYIVDAIKEASLQNARNLAYIEAILRRWKVEGKKVKVKMPAGPKYPNKRMEQIEKLRSL